MSPAQRLAGIVMAYGARPEVDDDGVVSWEDEIHVGLAGVPCLVRAVLDGDEIFLQLGCLMVDGDPDRLETLEEPSPPLTALYVDVDDETDEGAESADEELWLVAEGTADVRAGPSGIRHVVLSAQALVGELAVAGILRMVDALELDDSISRRTAMLEGLKARRPQDALDAAADLAARCRELGDAWAAALFDLAAADVAHEMGDISLCWELTEPAWSVLGQPVADAMVASAYAKALSGLGRHQEAVALLERTEREAPDRSQALLARGNRGVMYATWGRLPEAIDLLESALADPAMAEDHRADLSVQLAELKRTIGAGAGADPRSTVDLLDGADRILNDVAARLQESTNRRALEESAQDMEADVARLRARWHLLGRSQRARLLMIEGGIAMARGDRDDAGRRMRMAARLAEDGGDPSVARWAANLAASFGAGPAAPGPNAEPRERLMFHFNRGYWSLAGVTTEAEARPTAATALESVLAAVKVLDEERHRFAAMTDRRSWAELGARAFELALGLAVMLDRPSLVVELLERLRSQGVPVPHDVPPPGPAVAFTVSAAAEEDDTVHPISATLNELLVGSPLFATISGVSEIVDPPFGETLRLTDVVAAIAGPNAWWWSCHTFGRRVYWAVRSPDGELAVGRKDEDEVDIDLPRVASRFTTPRTAAAWAEHPLVEDRSRTRDVLLGDLATALLPPPLAAAARAAASAAQPLRLVWSPPPALGNVPIGLLPLGGGVGHRLLHGAIVTIAPPASLVPQVPAPAPAAAHPEAVVVGEGLEFADRLLGSGGLRTPAERVLGTAGDLEAQPPRASALATSASVRAFWSDPRHRLCLYYGHIDPGRPGRPDTSSLRLSDGDGGAPLDIGALLSGHRAGAPEAMVLCGCSSLGPASIGSGEWWGFSVGLLWQGSRQVIGSMWSLFDCAGTAQFAADLVARMRTGEDPAACLHRLQLEWLRAWEEGSGSFTGSAHDRHPTLWAGWAVTGVRGGPSLE